MGRSRRVAWLGAGALVAVTSLLALGVMVASRPTGSVRPPAVYPVPQSMRFHGASTPLTPEVSLVAGGAADQAALTLVTRALRAGGASSILRVSDGGLTRDPGAVPGTGLIVYVGGRKENGASAAALRQLGIRGASGLPAGGYVLGIGPSSSQRRWLVVLDGVDGAGTFYAATTLRQLLVRQAGLVQVPALEVRDWPALPLRGVIEGFYGTPWSQQARLHQLDFLGAHKMNLYVYAPKDDPYLRARWRDPYPPAELAQIAELVDRARANHVDFTYALSPGLSACYSGDGDADAVMARLQSLWDVGVRRFVIPLDDIQLVWHCSDDAARFGASTPAAAAAAQASLLNRVQREFIAGHPGAERLQTVPTEFAGVGDSPYRSALAQRLDSGVVVQWTGPAVVSPAITAQQAAAAKDVFGHDILVWDNYPVNDYAQDHLLLGPYTGRPSGLSRSLEGIVANPMVQARASDVALFTVADYTWNDAAYAPRRSWDAALAELAGHDSQATAALRMFADVNYASILDARQAPLLRPKIEAFRAAWDAGRERDGAAAELAAALGRLEAAPSTLRARLHDGEFLAETRVWLEAAGAWARAARAALEMLEAERGRNPAGAGDARSRVEELLARAQQYDVGLPPLVIVGDGVLDTFVDDALAENQRWLAAGGLKAAPLRPAGG